ncbi:hypothetical protein [Zhongshania sp.]|jgi:hypothetical protein|uniref:hypothetical protein n=1 Tax=Zhongshania sp. TaxID=1971902 RepID=UPI002A83A992|nr:hypothetical protein [Zhongshania sp.]
MSNTERDYLDALCFAVISHLSEADQPMGSAALAKALAVPHDTAQAAVCKLIVRDRIVSVGRCEQQRPIYRLRHDGAG